MKYGLCIGAQLTANLILVAATFSSDQERHLQGQSIVILFKPRFFKARTPPLGVYMLSMHVVGGPLPYDIGHTASCPTSSYDFSPSGHKPRQNI